MTDERRNLPGRMFDAVLGTVVNPVVNAVPIEDVAERIDVDELVGRIDVDELLGRIDVDAVLARVDLNAVLGRVDLNAVLGRVDPNALLDRVDANALLDRVEPNRLLDRVDPNRLLDRVDADRLLDRVDPDRLLARVDPNALLDRVDADRLIERLDLDAVMDRVDVNRLVERTELKAIIARSTTGIFTSMLDVVRTQIVTIDQVTQTAAGRIVRRREPRGLGPATPTDPDDRPKVKGLAARQRAVALQGHYAGSVSRFLAFLFDQVVVGALYALGTWLVVAAIGVLTGRTVSLQGHPAVGLTTYAVWWFGYFAAQWALAGRTIGMGLLGVLVVRADGADLSGKAAVVRTLAFPLSFLLFGIGFLLGLVRADRRELHDLIAGSSVIYAWDAQTAELRAEAALTATTPLPPS